MAASSLLSFIRFRRSIIVPYHKAEKARGIRYQFDAARRLLHFISQQASMTMPPCWRVLTAAVIFLATPSVAAPCDGGRLLAHVRNSIQADAAEEAQSADGEVIVPFPPNTGHMQRHSETFTPPLIFVSEETKQPEPDTIVFASMSGKCSILKIAGRDFACRAVAFFQTDQGRANFTIALDDPTDGNHIITFSGDNGRRPQDNLYELPIDRMLLNSKDRPKVDGLPVPLIELSAGMCKQLGSFAARQVSSISCTAIDKNGKKYELQYDSDGSAINVRRVRRTRAGHPAISPFD
jgi:hypothetical protein